MSEQDTLERLTLHRKVDEGDVFWYRNDGELHRIHGPAIEWANGGQEWWVNGVRHRDNGPAIITDLGSEFWFCNGIQHRADGPAVEWYTGSLEYWIDGKQLKSYEFDERRRNL